MKKFGKIASFTLTEMLVVLAIASIVVGLAYAVLSLFSKNLLSIQDNYSNTTKIRLLEEQLTIDFNRFHNIYFDGDIERLWLKTPVDSVFYKFSENTIFRNSDTILSTKLTLSKFFMGAEVSEGQMDAMKLEFGQDNMGNSIFISKKPDASHYMMQYGN